MTNEAVAAAHPNLYLELGAHRPRYFTAPGAGWEPLLRFGATTIADKIRPDRIWLAGITEHPTAEGKLYLSAIKGVYSNRIVGYSTDARMTASLAVSALRNAIARPPCLSTRTGVDALIAPTGNRRIFLVIPGRGGIC